MKKFTLYFILFICLIVLCGCNSNEKSEDDNSDSNDERTSSSTSSPASNEETEVSSFTTNILDQTQNRVDNIGLTCSKINEFILKDR